MGDLFLKKVILISIGIFMLFALVISFFASFFVVRARNEKMYLQGKIIYIDAGHGGKDNGASVDNVMEDSINLKISGYLCELLMDIGVHILMSRTSDYDLASLYQKNRKREDLNNRVKYINDSKPDLFISIHLNTYATSDVNGAQVFYQSNNEDSKEMANYIQQSLNVLTNKSRNIKSGDYFILNKTAPLGVLVECGFLSNSYERGKLNSEDYQYKVAKYIQKGIVDYFQKNH